MHINPAIVDGAKMIVARSPRRKPCRHRDGGRRGDERTRGPVVVAPQRDCDRAGPVLLSGPATSARRRVGSSPDPRLDPVPGSGRGTGGHRSGAGPAAAGSGLCAVRPAAIWHERHHTAGAAVCPASGRAAADRAGDGLCRPALWPGAGLVSHLSGRDRGWVAFWTVLHQGTGAMADLACSARPTWR